MSPPCHAFPVDQLPSKTQLDVKGKRRKLEAGVNRVDLSTCELLDMPQFKCEIEEGPVTRDSRIMCHEVTRFFRRCRDKKGSFMVETTAWEGRNLPSTTSKRNDEDELKSSKPYQWSSSWIDADTPTKY